MELAGRIALVTGGSRGIGRAVCLALAEAGADVAFTFRSREDAAQETASLVEGRGRRVLALQADVRDPARAREVVAETVRALGTPDLLVLSAGITRDAMSWKMSAADFAEVLDVNLTGAFHYAQAVVPLLREARAGRIVAVASINGERGKVGQTNYAASKGGLIAMMRSLARELGPSGVNVNVVAPGLVETDMVRGLDEATRDRIRAETMLGRFATPADVADAVVFLLSAKARHITGQVLRVDGGQLIA